MEQGREEGGTKGTRGREEGRGGGTRETVWLSYHPGGLVQLERMLLNTHTHSMNVTDHERVIEESERVRGGGGEEEEEKKRTGRRGQPRQDFVRINEKGSS